MILGRHLNAVSGSGHCKIGWSTSTIVELTGHGEKTIGPLITAYHETSVLNLSTIIFALKRIKATSTAKHFR